jgi:hypothetical protein
MSSNTPAVAGAHSAPDVILAEARLLQGAVDRSLDAFSADGAHMRDAGRDDLAFQVQDHRLGGCRTEVNSHYIALHGAVLGPLSMSAR